MSHVISPAVSYQHRGVNLDAKDILTGKSDPYIVIKIPVRDPRTLAPPVVPVDNKRYSDPTSSSQQNNNISTRNKIENDLTNAVNDTVTSNVGNYINSQGTYQPFKGQVGSTAGSLVQDATSTVVAVAMLGSALYHYTRKTHPPTPGFVQIYESDVAGNTLNPHWQPFRLGLYELCRGNLNLEVLIECYDWDRFKPSDYIGAIMVPVKTLLNAKDELKLQLLNTRNITSGLLFIQCRSSVPQIAHCDFRASAFSLSKKDLFGSSDPYFVIKVPQNIAEHPSLYNNAFAGHITIPSTTVACGIQNHKILKGYGEVFESFVVRKNLNPDWGTFRIGFYELCRGELDVNILVQCYDYNRILPSKLIGYSQVSIRSLVESGEPIALPLVSKKGKMAGTFYLQCTPSGSLKKQAIPQSIQPNNQPNIQQNKQPFVRRHPPLRYTRTLPNTNNGNTKIAHESPVLPPYSSPALESPYYYESPSYEYLSEENTEEALESYDPQYEEAYESYDPQSYPDDSDDYTYESPSYPSHPSCAFESPPINIDYPESNYYEPQSYSDYPQSYSDPNSFPLNSSIELEQTEEEYFEVPEIKIEPVLQVSNRKRPITRIPSYPPPVCPLTPEIKKASVSSPIISSSSLPFNAPPRRKPPPPPPTLTTKSASSLKSIPIPTISSDTNPPQQATTPPKRIPPRPPRSVVPPSASSSSITPSSIPSTISSVASSNSSTLSNPSITPSSIASSSSPTSSRPAPPRPARAKPPMGFSYLNPPSSIISLSSASTSSSSSNSSQQRPSMKIVTSCPQIERRLPNPHPAHYYVPPVVR